MGQANTKTDFPKTTYEPKIEVLGTRTLSNLGEIQIARDEETGAQFFLKKLNYYNKQDFEAQLNNCWLGQNASHPSLIKIIGYQSFEESHFCSEHYSINLYLETVDGTLEEKIAEHVEKNVNVSEVELQLVSEQLISILAYFQTQEVAHGNIHPATICFNDESYKLLNYKFNQLSGVTYINKISAPEVLLTLNGENQELSYNQYKADVFSLGVTLLSLATLTNSEELYNIETNELNTELLEERIRTVEGLYSPYFVSFLRDTLQVAPENRPDFVQLDGRFGVSGAIQNFCVNNGFQAADEKTLYVKVAREMLQSKGGYYADVEEALKSLKGSQVSQTPERAGLRTQHATPDGKVEISDRKRSGEPAILEDTPLKSSQIAA